MHVPASTICIKFNFSQNNAFMGLMKNLMAMMINIPNEALLAIAFRGQYQFSVERHGTSPSKRFNQSTVASSL